MSELSSQCPYCASPDICDVANSMFAMMCLDCEKMWIPKVRREEYDTFKYRQSRKKKK